MSDLIEKVEKLRKELCTGPCGQGSGPMQLAQERNVLLTEVKETLDRDPWDLVMEEEFARIADVKEKDGKTQIILEGPLFARFIMLLGLMLMPFNRFMMTRQLMIIIIIEAATTMTVN